MAWVFPICVIVVFPDHTHIRFCQDVLILPIHYALNCLSVPIFQTKWRHGYLISMMRYLNIHSLLYFYSCILTHSLLLVCICYMMLFLIKIIDNKKCAIK